MNSTEDKESLAAVVPKAVTLLLVIFSGAIGNSAVLSMMWRDFRMRTPRNMILLSASVADLILCCLVMPFTFISLLQGNWKFGDIYCHTSALLSAVFARVSVFNIASVVFEKYRFLGTKRFPHLSKRELCTVIGLVWSVPCMFGVVFVFFLGQINQQDPRAKCHFVSLAYHRFDATPFIGVDITVFVCLPLLFLAYCFWKIFRNSQSSSRSVISPDTLQQNFRGNTSQHWRAARSCFLFSFVSLFLVYPFLIAQFVNESRANEGEGGLPSSAKTATLWLFWLQCALKPLIYLFNNEKSYNFLKKQTQRLCNFWSRPKVHHLEARFMRGGNGKEVAIISRAQHDRLANSRRKYEQEGSSDDIATKLQRSVEQMTPKSEGPRGHHAWILPTAQRPSIDNTVWSSVHVHVNSPDI